MKPFRLILLAITLSNLPLAHRARADDADHRAEALFANRVLPLFKEKCFACHGDDPADIRGELIMHSRAGLLKGGENETPSLVPGKPGESPLYLAATRDSERWSAMPPKENDKLSTQQLADLRDWIAGGAPWPSKQRVAEIVRKTKADWDTAEGIKVSTSGGLAPEWTNRKYLPRNLWAYQPLWKDDSGRLAKAKANPVDVLVDEQLAALKLTAARLAERRTLIRRATFDLIGLPPSSQEIANFVNDPAADEVAFKTVVERLLNSPHYGEQWARHWLDVVRYADSSGYANDYERGNAWRYRDYVVRAFNDDKPYDQFIREQIAGDELIEEGLKEAGGKWKDKLSRDEALVAVGFLRMGPWELTGMEVAKIARQRFLDDATDTVAQVFLAHMLQCARCHDHKFDPIPTRDYYSMQAVFATTQLAERRAEFLPTENKSGFEEKKYLQQRGTHYQAILKQLSAKQTIAAARQWYVDQKRDASQFEKIVDELKSASNRKGPVSVAEVRRLMAKRKVSPEFIPPRHVGFEPVDFGMERIARKGLERLKWRYDRYEPFALSVYNGRTPQRRSVNTPFRMPENRMKAGELEATCILTGGDPFSPAQKVRPGVLSVVAAMQGREPNIVGSSDSADVPIQGRRLQLANWIASKKNPLTARVMVNRIWQWHFGQPLAGNPNNFGTTGKKPTHPKLLDYLATRFMESGWSIKAIHRLIMNSQAYRRSSVHPEPKQLARLDANGTSYAVFQARRLDAEELRDAMLVATGELNRDLGGIPVRPEMNLEAALQPRMVMGTFAEAWQPSPLPRQRHRRSLYALRLRGQRDPFFEVFNSPNLDLCTEARESSTVTPQVFVMFNSEITFDRALALANRLHKEKLPDNETIERAFQLTFGRAAEKPEVDACLAHWKKMTARHKTLKFEPADYPKEVVRNAVEENTGESFSFVEPLEVYADFIPDVKPSDVGPEIRGLAEVCLVLLNSNEFAYIY